MKRVLFVSLVTLITASSLAPAVGAQSTDPLSAADAHRDEASTRERVRRGAVADQREIDQVTAFAETIRAASAAGQREAELRTAQAVAPFDLGWGLP